MLALVIVLLLTLAQGSRRVAAQSLSSSLISFVHLSADAPALDIYIDGGRAVTSLGFSASSDYLGLAPGTHRVQVTPAGRLDALLSSSLTAQAGSRYTWVLSGLINPADVSFSTPVDELFTRVVPLTDPSSGTGQESPRIRIVNASPGSGALDVRTAGTSPTTVITGLAYAGVSDYVPLTAGSYTLNIYQAGSSTAIAAIGPLNAQSGYAYTFLLGGVLPGLAAANPANPVQGFLPVELTDQTTQRTAALTAGCNQVILNLPVGTPLQAVLTLVADPQLVTSIWRFDNGLKVLRVGYFSDPAAPLDYTTTSASPEASFICVSSNTTWTGTG